MDLTPLTKMEKQGVILPRKHYVIAISDHRNYPKQRRFVYITERGGNQMAFEATGEVAAREFAIALKFAINRNLVDGAIIPRGP